MPYYEDPCYQESQNQGVKILNQYSPVIRIPTAWAVPEGVNLVTLQVVALTDILIGSYIWNPAYGSYLVVSYDPYGSSIKVQKTEDNLTEVGTVIPSCSKFIITNYYKNQEDSNFISYELNPVGIGDGTLISFVNASFYAVVGKRVDISIQFDFEIITDTLDAIEIDIPFLSAYDYFQSMACYLRLGVTGAIGTVDVRPGSKKALIQKADRSAMAIVGSGQCNVNFFYRRP